MEIKAILERLKMLHGNENGEYVTTFSKDEFDIVLKALCLHWSVIQLDLSQREDTDDNEVSDDG